MEFHTEAPRATACEGLAQGPCMAARAGFEPTILQTKGVKAFIHSFIPGIYIAPLQ